MLTSASLGPAWHLSERKEAICPYHREPTGEVTRPLIHLDGAWPGTGRLSKGFMENFPFFTIRGP